MNAVIFSWSHPTNVVAGIALALGQALATLQIQVNIIDCADVDALRQAIQSDLISCDVAISIGALPLNITLDGRPIYHSFGKKFYFYNLDNFFYDCFRVENVHQFLTDSATSVRLRMICGDLGTANLINDFAPGRGIYMPYGGVFFPLRRHHESRQKRIAVVGNFGAGLAESPVGYNFLDLVEDAPHFIPNNLLRKFAQILELPGSELNILTIAQKLFRLSPTMLLGKEISRYFSFLDTFQKRRRRALAVKAIEGLPIDFFGSGWQDVAGGWQDVKFMNPVAWNEISVVCQNYQVLLNFDSNWDHCIHDRVFTAVGSGCRVLTNKSDAISSFDWPYPVSISVYDANSPQLYDLALDMFSCAPIGLNQLLHFRANNSWSMRADRFLVPDLQSSV